MAEPSDATLERALAALAAGVDVSGAERVVAAAVATLPTRTPLAAARAARRRLLLAVAAVVAVLVAAVAAIPPARHAVADLFGLSGVDLVRQAAPPTLPPGAPAVLDVGPPVALDDPAVVSALGTAPVLPAGADPDLGPPAGAFLDRRGAAPILTVVYPESDRLPATTVPGVGLLVTELPARFEAPLLRKTLDPDDRWEELQVAGQPAAWIEGGGPHLLAVFDRHGVVVETRTRLAGNVLVWQRGALTVRIEGGLDRDRAVALAATFS